MAHWSFLKSRDRSSFAGEMDDPNAVSFSPYTVEYLAAFDRTEKFGFEAPPRLLVRKGCVDMAAVLPVVLDYYERNDREALIGQTAAIHFELVALLCEQTGIPLVLTIGWIERHGKAIYQHDEALIQRFIEGNSEAWLREGCLFHLWMTSPAREVLDVTFAMNLGWARTREQCAALVIYQPDNQIVRDPVYHPTLVGPDFFYQTGGIL
jgi:hypothetical protein